MSHPANDRLHDQVSDHIQNRRFEYLEEYLEGVEGGDRFLGWFMCEYPEFNRAKVMSAFLEHKDSEKFYIWATDKAYEELTNEAED